MESFQWEHSHTALSREAGINQVESKGGLFIEEVCPIPATPIIAKWEEIKIII